MIILGQCCGCGLAAGNRYQTVTANVPAAFWQYPKYSGYAHPGLTAFDSVTYLKCELIVTWWNGHVDHLTWTIDPVTTEISGPKATDNGGTGPGTAQFAPNATNPWMRPPWNEASIPTQLPGQPGNYWDPSMGPAATTQTILSVPYTWQQAAAAALALLAAVPLLSPNRLYPALPDAQGNPVNYQFGYGTDAVIPGSAGVTTSLAIWPASPYFAGVTTPIGNIILGGTTGGGLDSYPCGANQHSGVFALYLADQSTLSGEHAVEATVCTVVKAAVFMAVPFGEQTFVEGIPPSVVNVRPAGEYIYEPNGAGLTWINPAPCLSPQQTYTYLTVPPATNPGL